MKRSLAGAVAGVLFASSAFSADLYQPQPLPEQPPEVAIAETSGWYLRGDVGYAFNDMRGAHFFQGSNGDVGYFDSTDLDDSWTLGGGVEYAVTNNITAKVEGSYINLDTRDNYTVNGYQGDRRDTEFGVVKAGLNYKFN